MDNLTPNTNRNQMKLNTATQNLIDTGYSHCALKVTKQSLVFIIPSITDMYFCQ